MKKLYTLSIGIFVSAVSFAQTFSNSSTQVIRDNEYHTLPIVVSGLPNTIDTSFGLCTVCLNVVHTYVGDVDIILIAPSGDSIFIANNQGGGGDNYNGTCFNMSASTSLSNAAAPFAGTFLPEYSLNNFNVGINPNGTWTLAVRDEAPQDTGHFDNVSITFCNNPPPTPPGSFGPCAANNGNGCMCPDSSSSCWLLPDMTATADIITQQHTETPGMIRLSNATPNIGWGPMEIHGSNNCWCDTVSVPCSTVTCPNGNPPTQQLTQTIYRKQGGVITPVDTLTPGTMSYHPSHGHVHINGWSKFTLVKEDTTISDPLQWPVIADGAKVSFCLINLGNCTANNGWCLDTNGNVLTMADIPNAPFGVVSGCGTDQGIYTGMLDIYDQNLPDMYIDLTGVCNGNYYIISYTDPDNNFIEQNENNNWVAVPITLTQQQMPITTGFQIASQSGNSVTFSFNNSDVDAWMWDFGDGQYNLTQNPVTHTYQFGGTYTVICHMENGCGQYNDTQLVVITGMEEYGNFEASLLSAAPNPSSDVTTVTYTMPEQGEMTLELYNILGEKVADIASGTEQEGKHTATIDFAALGLNSGSYFVKLSTPSHYSTLNVAYTEK
jgi:subtilisin-like proprotein convertase family protein/PKD repeat protein